MHEDNVLILSTFISESLQWKPCSHRANENSNFSRKWQPPGNRFPSKIICDQIRLCHPCDVL